MAVGVSPYPTGLDSILTLIDVKNRSITTLTVGAGTGDTTLNVASTSLFPTSGAITIDDEIIYYTGTTGTTFTGCTRASASTVAATHSNGATVNGHVIASHHSILASTIIAVETKLGYGASSQTPTTIGHVLTVTGAGQTAWAAAGAGAWGSITGTLSAQTDLQTALNAKQNSGAYITSLIGDVTTSGAPVGTATIAADAVTFAQMQNIATNKLLGRSTASTGDIEVISIGAGLTLAAGTLSSSGGLALTDRLALTPTAITSGVTAYFSIQIPTDLTMTASTESIGFKTITGTRQWATGALTTNRENFFAAPTYRFVGASTLTNAATVAISGSPIAGTNATITNSYALWVQTGIAKLSDTGVALDMGISSLTNLSPISSTSVPARIGLSHGTSGSPVDSDVPTLSFIRYDANTNATGTTVPYFFATVMDNAGVKPAIYNLTAFISSNDTGASIRDAVALTAYAFTIGASTSRPIGVYSEVTLTNNAANQGGYNEFRIINSFGSNSGLATTSLPAGYTIGLHINGAGGNYNTIALNIAGGGTSAWRTGVHVSGTVIAPGGFAFDTGWTTRGIAFRLPNLANNSEGYISGQDTTTPTPLTINMLGLNSSNEAFMPLTVHIAVSNPPVAPLIVENTAGGGSLSYINFKTNGTARGAIGYFGGAFDGMGFLNAAGNISFGVPQIASIVNYPQISPSVTTSPVLYEAAGTDTNIGITVKTKGSGNLLLNSTTGVTKISVLTGNGFVKTSGSDGTLSVGTSSADLAGVITDETGTGVLVFGTAPTFTTNIWSPAIYGGINNSSTLTLAGTSHITPTTAYVIINASTTGSIASIGVGTSSPAQTLGPGSTLATTPVLAHFVAKDNTNCYIIIEANGATSSPNIMLKSSGGTAASPNTGWPSGQQAQLSCIANDSTGDFQTAKLTFTATETHTASAHGTRIRLLGTTTGSLTITEWATLLNANLKIGGTAARGTTEGTKTFDLFDVGTVPAGTLASGSSVYSESGKVIHMDSLGNKWGIRAIGRSIAQSAAVGSVVTYTHTPADGTFEVSANVLVTATSGTTSVSVTCAYQDEGGTNRTATLSFIRVGGTAIDTLITNANGTVPYHGIPIHIRAKAGQAITLATTGTFTTVTYNVEGIIRQLA